MKIQTQAVKTYSDGQKQQRPLNIPITLAVNFEAASSEQLGDDFKQGSVNVYQRFGHPTTKAAADKIALLEGAEAGLVFSSGMGGISTALLAIAGVAGSHVVAQREIFAQTFTFLDETLRRLGVETTFVDVNNLAEVRAAIRPNTRAVYIESPSNPLLKLPDIAAISSIARERSLPLLIDSTFASPYLQNPIALGAGLVLHSATKFLAGHSDVLCGAVVGSGDLISKVEAMQRLTGSILDPHAAFLLLRGIKSLGVRVQRQSESALAIAHLLSAHAAVKAVEYPFLESSRYYPIARKQMRAGGGMIAFELHGGFAAARRFVNALGVISIATSLGGVESVVEIPYELDFSEDELGEAANSTGISPGLVRLSVGIEDLSDLSADIEQALIAAQTLPANEPRAAAEFTCIS